MFYSPMQLTADEGTDRNQAGRFPRIAAIRRSYSRLIVWGSQAPDWSVGGFGKGVDEPVPGPLTTVLAGGGVTAESAASAVFNFPP